MSAARTLTAAGNDVRPFTGDEEVAEPFSNVKPLAENE